jgi:hypothetical protein
MKKILSFIFVSAILLVGYNSQAQFPINDSFDYPEGELNKNGTNTNGWNGPWKRLGASVKVLDNNLGDDFIGKSVMFQTTGATVMFEYFREFSNALLHDGTSYWISFYIQRDNPDFIGGKWGGLSLFDGKDELLFIGAPWEKNRIGFDGNEDGRQSLIADTALTYVLIKLVTSETGGNAYMWLNYFGDEEPNILEAEATSPYPRDKVNTQFTKIRLAADQSQAFKFDMININTEYKNYFNSDDARVASIKVDGKPVADFDRDITEYVIDLPSGTTAVPSIELATIDPRAKIEITKANTLSEKTVIKVTAKNGIATMTYTLSYNVKTSVSIQNEMHLSVYPSPVKESLNVNASELVKFQLINAHGAVVKYSNNFNTKHIVNVSDLSKGIYLLKVNGKLRSTIKKISIIN